MARREWNAPSYDRIAGEMTRMGLGVLERLELRGDELVLDAGCGTGAVTERLLARLPRGRVIAVDASRNMAHQARERLGSRADVRVCDLLELELEERVDVVFSTATFHWIPDHERLFARLRALLAPGGRLIAQCGGDGNLTRLLGHARSLAAEPPYRELLEGLEDHRLYASAQATERRLHAAGFPSARASLTREVVRPEDPHEYLSTIILAPWLERMGERGPAFVGELVERLGSPVELDYVRLNIDTV